MTDYQKTVFQCYGRKWKHPLFRYYERVANEAQAGDVFVDAGCGRDMPLRDKLAQGVRYVGIDRAGGIRADLVRIPLRNACADVVASKSVLEHLKCPKRVFTEIGRILKPGGKLIVLTPNLWDITSLGARVIPNGLHPRIVKFGEGREEEDTFPTYYLANTDHDLQRLCWQSGLRITVLEYWGQYPSILHRWPSLLWWACRLARVLDDYHTLRKLRGWLFMIAEKSIAAHSESSHCRDSLTAHSGFVR